MFIWEKFKPLTEAMPTLRNRRCWQSCKKCGLSWSETNTEYVNMIKIEKSNFFICDLCTKSLKEENDQ